MDCPIAFPWLQLRKARLDEVSSPANGGEENQCRSVQHGALILMYCVLCALVWPLRSHAASVIVSAAAFPVPRAAVSLAESTSLAHVPVGTVWAL